jgi:hypothetical protein
VCQNWKGEMALVSAPGTMADRFQFTVSSESVASKIKATLGQPVALHYRQHKLSRGPCFRDSQYLVTDVRVMREPRGTLEGHGLVKILFAMGTGRDLARFQPGAERTHGFAALRAPHRKCQHRTDGEQQAA